MRKTTTWGLILGGVFLMVISYFALAAPWGTDGVEASNPRLAFAPVLFVIGVTSVFIAAVVYEVVGKGGE